MAIPPMSLLGNKLLEVTLLLAGLYLLRVILLLAIPLVPADEIEIDMNILSSVSWIVNTIFGLVVLWLMRDKGLAAIPVGVLAAVLPAYGSIFYLLTTLQNKSNS